MTLRSKDQKPKTSDPRKETATHQKLYLPTESTFLNSNTSRTHTDNISKVVKVVHKMEKNINELKKACDIPSSNPSLVSSREKYKDAPLACKPKQHKNMTVGQLQRWYTLINGKPTDNIQKLHKFYKQHFAPESSSSSSSKSPACRVNKRKTIQDIKISQPTSPLKNSCLQSRRGSETSKHHPLLTTNQFQKPEHIKTEVSSKNLKRSDLIHAPREDANKKSQSKEHSNSKKKLKPILKKSTYHQEPGLRASIPSLLIKQSQIPSMSKSRLNTPMLKSMRTSPSRFDSTSKQQLKAQSSKAKKQLTNQVGKGSQSKLKKLKKTEGSRSKETEKRRQEGALGIFGEIDQLSPISNSSFRHFYQKF